MGELAGHHFVIVDDSERFILAHRSQNFLTGRNYQITTNNQIGTAICDMHRRYVGWLGRHDQMADDGPAFLRQARHIQN